MGLGRFKSVVVLFLFLIVVFSFIGSVYAITGSIGNARMILRVDQGDKIERSILVKNVNDVSVDVELTADGDLVDDIDIKDDQFTLSPNEEKKLILLLK